MNLLNSPHLRRYCKECGNVTHLVPKKLFITQKASPMWIASLATLTGLALVLMLAAVSVYKK